MLLSLSYYVMLNGYVDVNLLLDNSSVSVKENLYF